MINLILKQRCCQWLLLALLCIPHAQAESALSRFLANDNQQDFLPVEKAFQVEAAASDATQAQIRFVIAPEHYLYRERIQITVPSGEAGAIASVSLPQGEEKNDPAFGKQQVFHRDTVATVSFAGALPRYLQVRYQGCSEKGLCYPPQTKQIPLNTDSGASAKQGLNDRGFASSQLSSTQEEPSAALLHSGQWWKIIIGFYGAGLLLALTPCVFPMIPILSGIIVGKNAHTSRTKAFSLSLAYTLGMSLTYTLAGVAAGLSGQLLSNALQTPLALVVGALIFVGLSLSMFGWYELKLPSRLENAFFNWSHRFKGGHLLSDFLMGAISALIISPCVAAPLAGALLYISQTHDVVLGAVALFSLSLGMGLPLLLIGASAGAILPKAGAWMNAVRELFGVLMLAVAVWIVSPLLPVMVQFLCWAALCIFPAIYLRALDALPATAGSPQRLSKGFAVILLLYGMALLVGAWSGARSPLQPLQGLLDASNTSVSGVQFQPVHSVAELNQLIQTHAGQTVMLDFYADWCVSCKEYAQFVFTEPKVQQNLQSWVLLQADVTANNAQDTALMKQFGLFGPPGIVFFNRQGQVVQTVKGYQNAAQFLQTLQTLPAL